MFKNLFNPNLCVVHLDMLLYLPIKCFKKWALITLTICFGAGVICAADQPPFVPFNEPTDNLTKQRVQTYLRDVPGIMELREDLVSSGLPTEKEIKNHSRLNVVAKFGKYLPTVGLGLYSVVCIWKETSSNPIMSLILPVCSALSEWFDVSCLEPKRQKWDQAESVIEKAISPVVAEMRVALDIEATAHKRVYDISRQFLLSNEENFILTESQKEAIQHQPTATSDHELSINGRRLFGAILKKYQSGGRGKWGVPYTEITPIKSSLGDVIGYMADFGKGKHDIWSYTFFCRTNNEEAHEVYEVHGSIKINYLKIFGPFGELGFPTSDEIIMDNIPEKKMTRKNTFQYGTIIWTKQAGKNPEVSINRHIEGGEIKLGPTAAAASYSGFSVGATGSAGPF